MKRQIRQGVFETNSSSTHSMTVCMKEEFDKWDRGELLFNGSDFIDAEEGRKKNVEEFREDDGVSEEDKQAYLNGEKSLRDLGFSTWDIYDMYHTTDEDDEYWERRCLETFSRTFKTPKGEEIFIFGGYGYDG